ncbi:unnamed protein product, partial [Nesidiocoris tenuis]
MSLARSDQAQMHQVHSSNSTHLNGTSRVQRTSRGAAGSEKVVDSKWGKRTKFSITERKLIFSRPERPSPYLEEGSYFSKHLQPALRCRETGSRRVSINPAGTAACVDALVVVDVNIAYVSRAFASDGEHETAGEGPDVECEISSPTLRLQAAARRPRRPRRLRPAPSSAEKKAAESKRARARGRDARSPEPEREGTTGCVSASGSCADRPSPPPPLPRKCESSFSFTIFTSPTRWNRRRSEAAERKRRGCARDFRGSSQPSGTTSGAGNLDDDDDDNPALSTERIWRTREGFVLGRRRRRFPTASAASGGLAHARLPRPFESRGGEIWRQEAESRTAGGGNVRAVTLSGNGSAVTAAPRAEVYGAGVPSSSTTTLVAEGLNYNSRPKTAPGVG